MPSPQRRQEIIDALRRGTVPQRGLDAFAVGLDRLTPTIEEELRVGRRRRRPLQGACAATTAAARRSSRAG